METIEIIQYIISFYLISWVTGSWIEYFADKIDMIEQYFCQKCYSFWFTFVSSSFFVPLPYHSFVIAAAVAFLTNFFNKHKII